MKLSDLSTEQLEQSANMLKAISHPMRMALIACLEDGNRFTVSQLHETLGIEQSTASHHLGILRDRGVVLAKREGKYIYYSLKHEELNLIINCVSKCCSA